ncbi:hypothetical protein K435DRAFT_877543 [Dendrothele bispora CBS 962.96]|uniref:Uncharacterized protein n=1 Tax=Dendrothele bispora (strain CBS 962.96) TaxID=1314807 RepID=A0A4V4HB17_DENBC|nr:hypothetical protein K435DRAFT_877543 [Dendrothele bispora CBS 962.96]
MKAQIQRSIQGSGYPEAQDANVHLKYVKFVEDHKAWPWFKDNVVSKLIEKRNEEDPELVVGKLTRATIEPWAYQGNAASSYVHTAPPGKICVDEWLAKSAK